MPTASLRILVTGTLAASPRQGGIAWVFLQYLLGLRRLGHEVWYLDQLPPHTPAAALEQSENVAWFRQVMAEFGFQEQAALLLSGARQAVGMSYAQVQEAARRTDIVLNISGALRDAELMRAIPVRAYLDLDPAFSQFWHEQGVDLGWAGHTHWLTVGQALGGPDCPVPDCGLPWIATLPPVVLEHWPVAERTIHEAFTTVANWRSYGSVTVNGVFYGQKAHTLRQFLALPQRANGQFVLALGIHPDETKDLEALAEHGWRLIDPAAAADTPRHYQDFIQGSKAELGIAKSGYVLSRCGWFSDRSVCYLASGRPVLAQETGFSRCVPAGEGLLAFSTLDEALAGVESLNADYPRHRRAARRLAEEFFDSDKVLSRLLDRLA